MLTISTIEHKLDAVSENLTADGSPIVKGSQERALQSVFGAETKAVAYSKVGIRPHYPQQWSKGYKAKRLRVKRVT